MSRDIVGSGCHSLAGSPVSAISSRGTGLLEAQRGAKGQTEEKSPGILVPLHRDSGCQEARGDLIIAPSGRNHLGVPSGAIIAPGRASGALRRRGPFSPAAPPCHSDAPPPEKRSHSAPGPTTDRAITKTQLAPILAESGGGGDGVVDQSRARSGRMRSNGVGGAQVGGDRRRGAGTHQAAMDGERAPVVPGHLCHGTFD
ncbi:unnamed protein product [Boreogadus saida]